MTNKNSHFKDMRLYWVSNVRLDCDLLQEFQVH
jgi:hypothetical protein